MILTEQKPILTPKTQQTIKTNSWDKKWAKENQGLKIINEANWDWRNEKWDTESMRRWTDCVAVVDMNWWKIRHNECNKTNWNTESLTQILKLNQWMERNHWMYRDSNVKHWITHTKTETKSMNVLTQ